MARRRHLLLFIHGLGGAASDFNCLSQSITNYVNKQRSLCDWDEDLELMTHSLKCNERKLTHAGLELMGKKMIDEMEMWLEEHFTDGDDKIILSVLCHSLGGLVARSGFSEMFFGAKKDYFLSRFHCGSYISMCTPHLGSRHPGGGKHVHMIGKALFRTGARFACKNFMGKTGHELYLKDSTNIEDTYLYKMSIPNSTFMSALNMFHSHTLIGSTRHDHIVPYCSSTIRSFNPHRKPPKARPSKCRIASFSGFKDHERKTFGKILHFLGHRDYEVEEIPEFSTQLAGENPYYGKKQRSGWYRDNLRHSKFNPTMIQNLQKIPWRRISFEFQLPSVLNHTNAHCLVLGSWFTGSCEDMKTAGIDAVRLIMMLFYMDHTQLVKKYYGITLPPDVHLDEEVTHPSLSDEEIASSCGHHKSDTLSSMDRLMVLPEWALEDDETALSGMLEEDGVCRLGKGEGQDVGTSVHGIEHAQIDDESLIDLIMESNSENEDEESGNSCSSGSCCGNCHFQKELSSDELNLPKIKELFRDQGSPPGHVRVPQKGRASTDNFAEGIPSPTSFGL